MPPTGGYQALVVDDEPHVRDLTRRALTRCGVECDVASDGDVALQMFDRRSYHAVITDLRMPNRHGHSVAVEVLKKPAPPRVVVVTGLAEPRLVRDLLGRGVDDVVHKPVNYDLLASKVLAILDRGPRAPIQSSRERNAAVDNPLSKLASIETTLLEITEIFDERLAGIFENVDQLPDPPSATADFVSRWDQAKLAESSLDDPMWDEMRTSNRSMCQSIAIAVPVTKAMDVSGEPFKLFIRDISDTGLRMLHTRATNASFLALKWNAATRSHTTIRVAARVTRCRPMSPFYDIGCQYVMAD